MIKLQGEKCVPASSLCSSCISLACLSTSPPPLHFKSHLHSQHLKNLSHIRHFWLCFAITRMLHRLCVVVFSFISFVIIANHFKLELNQKYNLLILWWCLVLLIYIDKTEHWFNSHLKLGVFALFFCRKQTSSFALHSSKISAVCLTQTINVTKTFACCLEYTPNNNFKDTG